jgi:hypothetical protein
MQGQPGYPWEQRCGNRVSAVGSESERTVVRNPVDSSGEFTLPLASVLALAPPVPRSARQPRDGVGRDVPIHVTAEWLGNSPKTALAHYTQTTEEHYRLAAQNPAQQAADMACTEPQSEKPEGEMLQAVASSCESTQNYLMTPTGFEPVSRP